MSDETPEDTKVVSLADRRAATGEPAPVDPTLPVEAVVQILESYLERARAGDVRAIGIAYITGTAVGTDWAYESHAFTKFELLSASDMLHHRLLREVDSGGTPS